MDEERVGTDRVTQIIQLVKQLGRHSIHQAIPLKRWTFVTEEKQWSEIESCLSEMSHSASQ